MLSVFEKEKSVAAENESLITLTADIVSAHVANNSVSTNDVGPLIQSVFTALQALGAPPPAPEAEKPKGAVSVRASIKPDHLVSMIDGKPYKTLRRHLSRHGYSPESYRDAFGLPNDYPMVAASYAEHRRALAHKIGLGRKPRAEAAPEPAPAPEPAAEAAPKARRGRKPKAAAE